MASKEESYLNPAQQAELSALAASLTTLDSVQQLDSIAAETVAVETDEAETPESAAEKRIRVQ